MGINAIAQKQSELTDVMFLHDNARLPVAVLPVKILELKWEIPPHPPYLPDPALTDCHPFQALLERQNVLQRIENFSWRFLR